MIRFTMPGLVVDVLAEDPFFADDFGEIVAAPVRSIGIGSGRDVTMAPDHAQCLLDRLRADLSTMHRDHAGNRARAVRDAIRRIERGLRASLDTGHGRAENERRDHDDRRTDDESSVR